MPSEAPLISGQLKAFPVANVLQFLGSSRVTGTLALSFRDLRAFVSLEEGMIVGASPAKPRGQAKKLTEEELLTRVAGVVSRAMAWPQGQFSFLVGNPRIRSISESEERPRLQAEQVLMHAAFTLDEERRVG